MQTFLMSEVDKLLTAILITSSLENDFIDHQQNGFSKLPKTLIQLIIQLVMTLQPNSGVGFMNLYSVV